MAIEKLGDDISKLIRKPGTHADGKGLYLRVRAAGQGSWTVKFGIKEQSLGPADLIEVETARALHKAMRLEKRAGRNPWALLSTKAIVEGSTVPARALPEMVQADDLPAGITRQRFADTVESFLSNSPEVAKWKPTSQEPRKYRRLKAGSLADLWADEITSQQVANELIKRWGQALVSAEKNRFRIKAIFDYARASGVRAKDAINPANNDDIKHLVAKAPKSTPLPSMPIAECPAFYAKLVDDKSVESRALRFLMLTAARTKEARDPDWSEIEGDVWHLPAIRMKEGEINGDHWVPLSPAALALLGKPKKAGRVWGDLPHDALDDKLKEYCEIGEATVHGFRTSFNGWAVKAGYTDKLIDHALHHAKAHGNTKTKRSYNREEMLEERAPMMAAWADFLTGSLTAS